MTDRIEVVIVGAGQAGLAVSRELTQARVPHVATAVTAAPLR